jgi:hypothetical protein
MNQMPKDIINTISEYFVETKDLTNLLEVSELERTDKEILEKKIAKSKINLISKFWTPEEMMQRHEMKNRMITCDCGSVIKNSNRQSHSKTIKHCKYLSKEKELAEAIYNNPIYQ